MGLLRLSTGCQQYAMVDSAAIATTTGMAAESFDDAIVRAASMLLLMTMMTVFSMLLMLKLLMLKLLMYLL